MCVLCPMYSVRDITMSDATCTCQGNRTTSSGSVTTSGDNCGGEWMWLTEKLSSLEIRVNESCRHMLLELKQRALAVGWVILLMLS